MATRTAEKIGNLFLLYSFELPDLWRTSVSLRHLCIFLKRLPTLCTVIFRGERNQNTAFWVFILLFEPSNFR
jgi:hypothetical protein